MSWKDEDVVQETWTDADIAEQPKQQPTSRIKRIAEGFFDPIVGAAQLVEKTPGIGHAIRAARGALGVESSMEDVVRERDAAYHSPEGIDAARIVGNVLNPISWVGGGASPLRAAYTGAAQSVLAPVSADANFLAEKAKQAGAGALVGTVLTKTLRGMNATPEAKALMEQGIQPSFGQSMGGTANKIEQKATSIPFVGDAIQWARSRPLQEWQERAIERVSHGKQTLDEATAYASSLYEKAVPHLKPTVEAEQGVRTAMREALADPQLVDSHKAILSGTMMELFGQNFSRFKALDGPEIKVLDSQLGALARKYQAGDPMSKTLADQIRKVQMAFREGLESGLPPELSQDLQRANEIWRNTIPLHKAASQRADERILPRALQRTMAKQQGIDPSRMAHDPLLHDAMAVLPNTVPDSGTAGRVLLGSAGLMGSGALGALPQYLAAGGAAYAGATRPAQAALLGNTAWQKALQPYDATIAAITAAALRNANRKQQPVED